MKKTVYVGLSGGVDSSVSAALLVEQGYRVVGIYMKNWSKDLPSFDCPWKEDYQDSLRVATQLGIEHKLFDFESKYKQKVVDYMLAEYLAGRTPNPDIMCNQEIKFKLFLNTCLEDGADLIATGHYARISKLPKTNKAGSKFHNSKLWQAVDKNKDQTYFLYRIQEKALERTLFPIGELTKPEVRKLAKIMGLATAEKKESMGICFVGKVGIKDFLSQYVKPQEGAIIDQSGKEIGRHSGAIFYTIGQRTGLGIGGGLPYYVVSKDIQKNEVYVSSDLADSQMWTKKLILNSIHLINGIETLTNAKQVRLRHRAPLLNIVNISRLNSSQLELELYDEVRAVTPGQSAVFFDNEWCLGGGIVV